MSYSILVVDDEAEIADLIELYMRNEDYHVYKCNSGNEARRIIEGEQLDLAILDIMLPDTDGFELCGLIRSKHNYPIIMLTAKDEDTDKITGLTLGADDYVTKPFSPLELVARVRAQLRRYKKYNKSEEDNTMSHAGLALNIRTHDCLLDGEKISLTPTEFAILRILLERKGSVVSSEQLFHEIWEDEYYTKNNNTITVHIRHLREKMNDSAEQPKYIKTVWGVGYTIEV